MTSVYNASLALKDAKNFKELLHVSLAYINHHTKERKNLRHDI
jgi:hypothetical protein